LLLTGALLGLAFANRVAMPTHTVASLADLPSDLGPLSDRELALFALRSSETLFYVLTSLLAIVLITWLCWWGEAGFNRSSRWRNPHLLLFPLLVSAPTLLDGIRVPGPAFFTSMLLVMLLAAFSEEALYGGIAWRALVPKKGVIQAVFTTSLLSGVLRFGRSVFGSPRPEAFYDTDELSWRHPRGAQVAHRFDLARNTVPFRARFRRFYLDTREDSIPGTVARWRQYLGLRRIRTPRAAQPARAGRWGMTLYGYDPKQREAFLSVLLWPV